MRVPLSWLKEYVDITLPVEELAERMTLAGLEVAAIEHVQVPEDRPAWDPEKIVVGEIVEVRPHPNADRLTLAVVDYGGDEPEIVVTGAPNIKVGDTGLKAPFARRGARLYDGHVDGWKLSTLKPGKIRGIRSEAMVCSEKELGLRDSHEEVLLLPHDAPVGVPLADYLDLSSIPTHDIVLDLDLTPNLARCLSIIGVAREVAALTGQKLKKGLMGLTGFPSDLLVPSGPSLPWVEIEIADPDLCSRYSATLTKGVKVGPSPYWMQRRLTLAGMRPINNIVDITNYVMLEWGQPLHAFDYNKLRGRTDDGPPVIIVRRARPGESIITLDDVERALTPDMLLITDPEGPIAIAGVMGGFESEVTVETTDILLESANFDNVSNRRTSQALKLPSEASLRFGKGIPASLTIPAITRATELMRQLARGVIAQGIADAYPVPQKTVTVEITPAEVERIMGIALGRDEIVRILESLEFKVRTVEGDEDRLLVTVPDHRLDVELPADLIEEIARVYGYDRIPTTLMSDELPPQRQNLALEREEWVRDVLAGCGLTEVITYSLTNLESVGKLGLDEAELREENYIRLANPLTSEREYMRRTLMNHLLETLRDNLRFTDRVAIFEVGQVYLPKEGKPLPDEPRRLGIIMSGPRMPRSWLAASAEAMDFFDLKGVVETLLTRLGVAEYTFEPTAHPTFHPGRTAELRLSATRDKPLAILGEVHPLVRETFDLPDQPVCLAEFDLEALLARAQAVRPMQPISRFPPVVEDLAIVVAEEVPARRVQEVIAQAGGELLTQVTLFDVWRGGQIPVGKKSLAYTLTYQGWDHTLGPDEVNQVRERILQQLAEELGAELRA
ncbi:MAG TPA: phenylalanine--tRNA ligase subunit beta [Anaerolineae bacterium]|nr:phenylalanine--tRNA ligase subunit beta [Anaerolineae bacterium]